MEILERELEKKGIEVEFIGIKTSEKEKSVERIKKFVDG